MASLFKSLLRTLCPGCGPPGTADYLNGKEKVDCHVSLHAKFHTHICVFAVGHECPFVS